MDAIGEAVQHAARAVLVRQRWLGAKAAEAAERRTGAGHPPKARLQTLRG